MYEDLVKKLIPTLNFTFPYTAEDWCEHLYLENQHSHSSMSNCSTVDSPVSMEDYADRIQELGGKCIFTMEHGWQGSVFHIDELANKTGLKMVVGSEVYWVKDRHEKDNANCHMIIQAINDNGRRNLNYIISMANIDGYYYKPRVDLDLVLSLNPNDFIISSACVAGWKYHDADEIWLKIAKHFGKHFFFEVQPHNTDKQAKLNARILKLAHDNNIDIICGLDSHYVSAEKDDVKREKLLEYKNIHYDDEDNWFLDYPDTKTVIERFKTQSILTDEEIIRAILNTNVFASTEVEEIVLDHSFKIPTVYPGKTYDEKVAIFKRELNKAYKKETLKSKAKADGIRYEAQQIIDSGVVDYFLTSKAMVDEATQHQGGILTTTARGSSSSFIVNKLLGLTTIDRFNSDVPLYPERFLTKDRVVNSHQMPDEDLNIVSQEPFERALKKLLGEHGCYPLMTLGTLKEKNAWQIFASVNGVEPSIANKISKYIDAYNKALKHASDEEKEDINIKDYIPDPYYDIYMGSREYQGIVVGLGCHPCGHLIFNGDIRYEIGIISAISEATKERTLVAAAEGKYLDSYGYVKEDLLIVDSVGLTHEFFQSIGQPVPSFDELHTMVNNDKPTWDIYANGITCCVNQCEKESTTQKVMKYRPQTISELSQFIAAIRPGFASLLDNFLNRKPYTTGEPQIDATLEASAHYMLYQESIMQVLNFLGLPMTDTYGVVKSISKKKLKGEYKENLLNTLKKNWLEKIGNMDNFDKVWTVINDAASYSFNCLSGDTRIKVIGDSSEGHWYTLDFLYKVKKYKNFAIEHGCLNLHKQFNTYGYGYSLSMKNGKLYQNKIVGIYEQPKAWTYRITTNSGYFVVATENHKFPTVDGIKHLSELTIHDKLYRMVDEDTLTVVEDPIISIEKQTIETVYDVEMSGDVAHNFVANRGIVVCNCSHSLAMAGDSLYQAWFKAHHTAKFYEVSIKHYQKKDNKNKIDALIKEALTSYGYRLADYHFGDDNREVKVDDEKKLIVPNISSIKGLGNKVGNILYQLGQDYYDSFYDVMTAVLSNQVNSTILDKLIKIGYFGDYGTISKLLTEKKYFELFKNGNAKSISKDKATENDIPTDILEKYSKITTKQYSQLNTMGILNELAERTPNVEPTEIQKLKYEYEVMGICRTTVPKHNKREYLVLSINQKKTMSNITLYEIWSGKTRECKCWNRNMIDRYTGQTLISDGNIIHIYSMKKDNKREKTDKINPDTGKYIWIPIEGEYEYWLTNWRVIG